MSIISNCRKVHRLASEGMDRRLSLGEHAEVRLHLLGCPACRNFARQMQLLRDAMRSMTPDADAEENKP